MKFISKTPNRLIVAVLLAVIVSIWPNRADASPSFPLTGFWNGFLGHLVVGECSSLSPTAALVKFIVKDNNGTVLGEHLHSFAPYGSHHVVFNQFDIANKYGTYEVVPQGSNPILACHTAIYRLAPQSASKYVEYAFSLPTYGGVAGRPALTGETFGVVNSINPSGQSEEVRNWLSVTNLDVTNLGADVLAYNQAGQLLPDQGFRINNLAPGARVDLPVAHPLGQVTGLYKVQPDNDSQAYSALVTLYGRKVGGGYSFAFPLIAAKGTCDSKPVPVSTMDPATNYGEIANISSAEVSVNVEIRNSLSQVVHQSTHFIPAYGQTHIHINQFLGARKVGTMRVACLAPASGNHLLVDSAFYGHLSEGDPAVEWAYVSQAREQTASNPITALMAFNSFFEAANWNKVFDASGSASTISLIDLAIDGTLIANATEGLPAGGSRDFGLHQLVSADTVGAALNFGLNSGANFSAELLRVYPHSSGKIGYIMNIPAIYLSGVSRDAILSHNFITNASPNVGSSTGGTRVTITGIDFTSSADTLVTFGGLAGTDISVLNSTTLQVTTPAHAAGAVDVVVTNSNGSGQLADGFTYLSGNVFYVDPATGSSSGDGSFANPWKTIEEVIDDDLIESKDQNGTLINSGGPIKSGDRIILRSGNHGEIDIREYHNDSTITIAADTGATVNVSRIEIIGGTRWKVEGLNVSKSCTGGYLVNIRGYTSTGPSTLLEFDNLNISTAGDSSTWTASQWSNNTCGGVRLQSTNSSIRNSTLRNVDHGILLAGNGNTAENNLIDGFAGDGVVGGGSDISILHNRIQNNYNVDGNHDDFIQFHKGSNPCNCNNVQVIGNRLIRTTDPNRPHQGAIQGLGLFDGPYDNWFIANNLVNGDHWHGISGYDMTNSTIINNTVVGGSNFGGPAGYPARSWIRLPDNSFNNIVRNNITSDMGVSGDDDTVDTNIELSSTTDMDALFIDWANKNFHLKAGASAINAGNTNLAPSDDLEKKTRGGQPDIGAYEY